MNNLRPERSNKVIEFFSFRALDGERSNGVGSGKTSRSSWVAGIHV